MTEQTPKERQTPHDPRGEWPIIDGPRRGARMRSVHDQVELAVDPDKAAYDTVRYYLRKLVAGGYVWSINADGE